VEWILLPGWWFIVAVTIGSLILLALTILSGILIAIGVLCSSLYMSLKEWRWQYHVPGWAWFLDDL